MHKKYYKIVTENSYLRQIYDIADISSIPIGANIIEFKTKMSINRMFDRAVKEFKNNHDEKIKIYSGLPLQKFIDA